MGHDRFEFSEKHTFFFARLSSPSRFFPRSSPLIARHIPTCGTLIYRLALYITRIVYLYACTHVRVTRTMQHVRNGRNVREIFFRILFSTLFSLHARGHAFLRPIVTHIYCVKFSVGLSSASRLVSSFFGSVGNLHRPPLPAAISRLRTIL